MPCERELKHLLNLVNAVTAPHRHGQSVSKRRLDDLANAQVEYEEAMSACDESPWSSMESAPKDGTEVDLTDGTDRCTDCLWSDKKDAWVYWGPDDWDSFGWVKIDFVPKGWMPLPVAPEVGK